MNSPENIQNTESQEERDERRARGEISAVEIAEYLKQPDDILFEHRLVHQKKGEASETEIPIKVRALTKEFMASTLESLKDSWDENSYNDLAETLQKYFDEKERGGTELSSVEYYIATDEHDSPLAMTGLYTVDIQGGAGFATRDRLDSDKHNLLIGLGWYSVSKKAQAIGLGKYFLEWSEQFAASRGAALLDIETDDWENSRRAVELYKKMGYEEGYPIKDYYGKGRDMYSYYHDVSEDTENNEAIENIETTEITPENKEAILNIAKENYSADRFKEFEVCLDLFLSRNKSSAIYEGHSVVVLDEKGAPISFAIFVDGIYKNATPVYWIGADKKVPNAKEKVLTKVKAAALANERNVVIINNEGEDGDLPQAGFTEAHHGIPGAFGKGDETKLLFFTKKFNNN